MDTSTLKTAILISTLWRHKRLRDITENIIDTTHKEPFKIYFTAEDHDQETIDTVKELEGDYPEYVKLLVSTGNTGPSATNYSVVVTDEPLIYIGCDDLEWTERWLTNAKKRLTGQTSVVATWNGHHPDSNSGFLIKRSYINNPGSVIDQPGVLLHPEYYHYYADLELQRTAEYNGVYAFAKDSCVIHHNISSSDKYGEPDKTASKIHNSGENKDDLLYNRRKHLFT